MPNLDPTGAPVESEGVVVSSPGLAGTFTIITPEPGDVRAAGDAFDPDVLAALQSAGYEQQVTVDFDPQPVDIQPTTTRSTSRGRDSVGVQVDAPAELEGQVALLYDENTGAVSWYFPTQDEDSAVAPTRAGRQSSTFDIEAELLGLGPERDSDTRGLAGVIGRKILKVFCFKLVKVASGKIAKSTVGNWEDKNAFHRLRSFSADSKNQDDVSVLTAGELDALEGDRALLFIHGTFSRTHRAFGAISDEVLSELSTRYGGRVFAFDHPTVSASPSANVSWFLEAIGTRSLSVDIVAHSRGGLVARELLVQGAGRVDVENLVFVATPNDGTDLCLPSNLDTYLTVMSNLLGIIPGIVGDVLSLIASAAKHVAIGALEGLPGLTAMTPREAVLNDLARSSPGSTVFRAFASDYEPGSGEPIHRVIRDRFTDAVFKNKANDLVVPTRSCFEVDGAQGFPIQSVCEFAPSDAVDHSGFWTRDRFEARLLEWLPGVR